MVPFPMDCCAIQFWQLMMPVAWFKNPLTCRSRSTALQLLKTMKLAMNCEVPRQLLKLSKKNVLQNQPSLDAGTSEVIICHFHLYTYLRFFEGHEIRHASPTRYINIEEEIVYEATPAWIKICLGGVCWLHKRHELLRKLDISLMTVAPIAWSS